MKTLFRRIPVITALCLAAPGLNSCISTTHCVVKAWGQSADEVYWVNELGGTTDCLYRIGDELYVQAYRSSGDVTMGGISPWGNYLMLDWATPKYPQQPTFMLMLWRPQIRKARIFWPIFS